jgi:hypothetical protein
MSPESFWKLFKDKFTEWWNTPNSADKYEDFKYDSTRTCRMRLFLMNLGCKNYHYPYYVEREAFPHIDVGYFSEYTPCDWAKWSFEIAIEHENKEYPAWRDECSKLMGINAGLKVLIAYWSEPISQLKTEIEEFPDIYDSRRYHQEKDQYLFIFIPRGKYKETESFVVYEFKDNKLQLIQPDETGEQGAQV